MNIQSTLSAPAERTPQISQAMSIGRASLLMALMVALSRVTGFGRLMLTSHLYGVSPVTDAYNAAFNIPDTLSILIAGGALATGFVPVFTEYLSRGQTEQAIRTFRIMWTLLAICFGALTLGLLALTWTRFGTLLAPQKVTPSVTQLYLHLLRILLVGQFFFVLGGLFSGTLNALRQFWYFALQPVAFNGGIILGGLIGPRFGLGIESQAWGALAGALFGSIAIQIPAIYRNGLTLKPLWERRDPGVQRVLSSLLPIVFGLASGQLIALLLPKFFAAGLPTGDLTALDNANRLMQVPLAVLASGPAIALFPTLALLAAQNDTNQIRLELARALRRTLVLCLLATALLLAVRHDLIKVLLEHGQFTPRNTQFTAAVLACYTWGIVGLSAQQFLSRGFYALQDTRTPTLIGLSSMAIFGVLAAFVTFVAPAGAPGLALVASLSITILAIWMGRSLQQKLGGWDDGATIKVLWKASVAAVAAFVLAAAPQMWHAQGTVISLVKLTISAGLGTVAFLVVASTLKLEETEAITSKFAKLTRKFKK